MAKIFDSGVLDTLDGVDPAYHGMFTQKNGKFEFDGVAGLKTDADIARIQSGLTKERNDHKLTRDKLSKFGDLDPEQVASDLARIPELELAAQGKVDEAKLNTMVEGRLAGKLRPVEQKLNTALTENAQLKEKVQAFEVAEMNRKVRGSIAEAIDASKGFVKSAIDDALLLGERLFQLNEDGTVTTKDNVGVTPGMSPKDWLAEMQGKKAHWWGPSEGGGANPGSQAAFTGENPWSYKNWNLTKQGEIVRADPKRAATLAALAGTKVGGTKPPEKK